MTHPIVVCARGWLGTRFHHQGRIKKTTTHKGGVDCLGLLVGIAKELDLRSPDGQTLAAADELDYSHQPDVKRLRQRLTKLLQMIPIQAIKAGDVVLLNIDQNPQHLAVVSDLTSGLAIIHAYAPARAVVEHQLDEYWTQRIEAAFRVF